MAVRLVCNTYTYQKTSATIVHVHVKSPVDLPLLNALFQPKGLDTE